MLLYHRAIAEFDGHGNGNQRRIRHASLYCCASCSFDSCFCHAVHLCLVLCLVSSLSRVVLPCLVRLTRASEVVLQTLAYEHLYSSFACLFICVLCHLRVPPLMPNKIPNARARLRERASIHLNTCPFGVNVSTLGFTFLRLEGDHVVIFATCSLHQYCF